MRYIDDDQQRSEQYARARESQADKLAEDLLQIADDGLNDTYTDSDGNKRTDQDVIARSRLRVDARKWLAGKMAPKKYGDRQIVEGPGENGAHVINQTVDVTKLGTAELGTFIDLLQKVAHKHE